MRTQESRNGSIFENNEVFNVADSANLSNPLTGAPVGPTEPLAFLVGADGEYTVDGFDLIPTANADDGPCFPIRTNTGPTVLACL